MRPAAIFVLAAAAGMLIGCDLQPAPSAPSDSVPAEVQELLSKHGVTDQSISECAEQDLTGSLWPPVPDTSCSVYAVTLLWGHLPRIRMPPFPEVLWDGQLSAASANGVVKVLRPIDFEEGEDRLLPVTNPAAAAWESTTAGDFDGLGLLLRVPAASTATAGVLEVVFKKIFLSITLPIPKLERLIAYYPVSDTDGVAVLARRVDRLACPSGFIKGEWEPRAGVGCCGTFRGMWYDLFGVPVGTMAGVVRTNPDGGRAFEGWLSGVWLTVVLAELQGTWSGEACGRFEGTYRYLNSKETGTLWGEFGNCLLPVKEPRLPLAGKWKADCLSADADPGTAEP